MVRRPRLEALAGSGKPGKEVGDAARADPLLSARAAGEAAPVVDAAQPRRLALLLSKRRTPRQGRDRGSRASDSRPCEARRAGMEEPSRRSPLADPLRALRLRVRRR